MIKWILILLIVAAVATLPFGMRSGRHGIDRRILCFTLLCLRARAPATQRQQHSPYVISLADPTDLGLQ